MIVMGLLCFVGVLALGKILNKTQQEVFLFHKKLRLWDINELRSKCDKYL